MKITKRIGCLTLAVLMLLATLISCGKSKDEMGEEQLSVNTETSTDTDEYGQEVYSDPTAGLKFGGKQVNFLVRSETQYMREWFIENPTSNLDQKIHARNVIVEEDLDVKLNYIVQDEGEGNTAFYTKVANAGAAGEGEIDVVSGFAAYATNPNVMPYYVNWFDSEKLPYLNLDRKYWNQNYIKDAAAFGKLYVCIGDMNLSLYDRCMVVFFNKAKAAQYLKDSAGNTLNLYQLVQSGQWYYETFYNMTKDLYEDTGTAQDQRDIKDFYGVTGIKGSEASDAFLYSLGGMLSTTVSDGSHSLVTDSKLQKLGNIYTAMTDFWYSNGAVMPTTVAENCDMFTSEHALFTVDCVYHTEEGLIKLHAMKGEYGIIPMPKYDADQENYMTGVQDAYNVLSIMHCGENQNLAMISAVLEKMAYESYNNVRPYYVETILKLRTMDYDSSNCFNYVIDNIRFDFCDIYCAGIGWVRNALWRAPFQANASFETNWSNYWRKNNKKVQDFDAWLVSQG